MITYNELKLSIVEEYSKYSGQYNINIKIGKSNPDVKLYIISSQIYKILSSAYGDEDEDVFTKIEIQSLIKLLNKLMGSTIQIDYAS